MQPDQLIPLNALKAKLARQELGLCMSVRLFVQPDIVLIAKAAGLDALYIDLEHGSISLESLRQVSVTAIAANFSCLVRVANINDIPAVLDTGASGVICPNIETADEARAAVTQAKFPPQGHRGVAGVFAQFGYQPMSASKSLPALNANTMVIVQIESATGLANLEAIAAIEGIDMLLVGANDLLADLGLVGDYDHPELRNAYLRVIAACKANNIACGIGGLTSRPAMISELVRLGANFISVGNDITLFANTVRSTVEKFLDS